MIDNHPPPSGYPWSEPVRVGMLHHDGFVEAELADELAERVPVVAVGSNASPTVLRRKLGSLLSTGLPVAAAVVDGLQIGHSAHVSARGYVAAAPTRGLAAQPVTVCWFDAAQLAVLDATEPNYGRIPLPGSMPCRVGGAPLTGAQIYESVHGVLGEAGRPLQLLDQSALLSWLGQRLPADVAAVLDHDLLTSTESRERVRTAMVAAELVLPSGLHASLASRDNQGVD